jgi:tetratricopeptide (TPR) repeat protein
VRLSDADRWDLHPLLRRYVSEQLARDPDALAAVRTRHAQAYLNRVIAKDDALWGADPQTALDDVTAEWENVQAAWGYALTLGADGVLRRAAAPLARYLDFKGHFQWGVEMFDRAARLLTSKSSSGSVGALMMAVKAHFMMRQADYEAALWTAKAAFARVGEGDTRFHKGANIVALSLLVMGTVHRHTGAYVAAHDSLSEALEIARGRRLPRLEAEILRTLGAVRWRLSDYAAANAHYRAALILDRELGDRRGEGWTLNGLGLVAENQGHYGRAADLYEKALVLVKAMGDLWGESIVLGNLGYLYGRLGDASRARQYYRQDLSICRSLGDQRGESWTQGYLSLLAHQEGRYRVSLRHGRRALALAQEIGHDPLIASAFHAIGHAYTGLGEWDEAAHAYQEALTLRREVGRHALAMETLAGLIRVALGQDEVERALSMADEILNYLDTDTVARTNEYLRIYLTIYRALAAGSDPRARDVLADARTLLKEKAAKIEVSTLREAFLHHVTVHRKILALADREL